MVNAEFQQVSQQRPLVVDEVLYDLLKKHFPRDVQVYSFRDALEVVLVHVDENRLEETEQIHQRNHAALRKIWFAVQCSHYHAPVQPVIVDRTLLGGVGR